MSEINVVVGKIEQIRHWIKMGEYNGTPVEDLFGIAVTKINGLENYVINSQISDDLIDRIKGYVFPCKMGFTNMSETLKREQEIATELKVEADQMMAVVIGANLERGPIGGFVRIPDLFRTPEELTTIESESEIEAHAIALAYEIITGEKLPKQE